MLGGLELESLVEKQISVITNDGRNIVEDVQQLWLGLYVIRDDNISIIGEVDGDLDGSLESSQLKAHPLKPVTH